MIRSLDVDWWKNISSNSSVVERKYTGAGRRITDTRNVSGVTGRKTDRKTSNQFSIKVKSWEVLKEERRQTLVDSMVIEWIHVHSSNSRTVWQQQKRQVKEKEDRRSVSQNDIRFTGKMKKSRLKSTTTTVRKERQALERRLTFPSSSSSSSIRHSLLPHSLLSKPIHLSV